MITSKEEAWKPFDGEVSISINKEMHDFKFTRNWFRNRNQCTFSTFLPKFFSHEYPTKIIQIGVFEGMDLVWTMQNLAKHPNSQVLAIDPWAATTKLDAQTMDAVHARAVHNLKPWRNQIRIERDFSSNILTRCITKGIRIGNSTVHAGQWNMIVIDGDHNAPAVYDDAMKAIQLVPIGGMLLFDDVRNQIYKKDHVAQGLEQFLLDHPGELELVFAHRYVDCYKRVL